MSVLVTSAKSALYCSTTGRAFGPVFANAYDAARFLEFVAERDGRDPREMPIEDLETLKWKFEKHEEGREPSDVEMFGAGAR